MFGPKKSCKLWYMVTGQASGPAKSASGASNVEEEDAGQVRHETCVRSVQPMRVESKQVVGASRTNRRSSEVSGLVSRPLDP